MEEFLFEYLVPAFLIISGTCAIILLVGFTIIIVKDMLNN